MIHIFFSECLEQTYREYINMTLEKAAESECPMMFISFPSAKDLTWEEKFPGKYSAVKFLELYFPNSF